LFTTWPCNMAHFSASLFDIFGDFHSFCIKKPLEGLPAHNKLFETKSQSSLVGETIQSNLC
jgi:hypothetical protein